MLDIGIVAVSSTLEGSLFAKQKNIIDISNVHLLGSDGKESEMARSSKAVIVRSLHWWPACTGLDGKVEKEGSMRLRFVHEVSKHRFALLGDHLYWV